MAFSPDGDRLATASSDGLARLWALTLDELVRIAENSVTRSLTDGECLHVEHCNAA